MYKNAGLRTIKHIFFVILQCRYHLVLFNGLRRNRMKRRENVKKESRLFI